MSQRLAIIFSLLCLLFVRGALADWGPNGVVVTSSLTIGGPPVLCPDGAGGLYVGILDGRDDVDGDIYIQRITLNGLVAPGWPSDGFPVCRAPTNQTTVSLTRDGLGGTFVLWHDFRNAPIGMRGDIYFQRITATGSPAPGWNLNGNPVVIAPQHQRLPQLAADGLGGALVTWYDTQYGQNDVQALYFDGAGAVASGWPSGGLRLTALPSSQAVPQVIPVATGSFIVSWADGRPDTGGTYAQRIAADGQIEWTANGRPIYIGPYRLVDMVSDGVGGGYAASDNLPPPPYVDGAGSYILSRFTGDGTLVPGWPAGGISICQAPEVRQGFRMTPDGTGGALMVWSDYRNYFTEDTGSDLYAMRILPDGTRAPGWPANGLRVTNLPGWEEEPKIVGDGQGGAYIAFKFSNSEGDTVHVQHLLHNGAVAPGWPANGRNVMDDALMSTFYPELVSDSLGGCIVAWSGIRARRFTADGPVATAISLTSVTAQADGVVLVWHGPGAVNLSATIERRREDESWVALDRVTADASGSFTYEDRAVEPGERYAYRLRWRESDGEHTTNETWVTVPARLALALEGLRPNPAARDLTVWFTLPARGPARLELLDVTGRVRRALDLSDRSAGRQAVRFGDAGEFEPGVYWIRLVQGGEHRLTRGVLIR